jgi:quinol monooxygenase YgiN
MNQEIFWSSLWWNQEHYEVHNVVPEFKAKVAKHQNMWKKAIGNVLPTTRGQEAL